MSKRIHGLPAAHVLSTEPVRDVEVSTPSADTVLAMGETAIATRVPTERKEEVRNQVKNVCVREVWLSDTDMANAERLLDETWTLDRREVTFRIRSTQEWIQGVVTAFMSRGGHEASAKTSKGASKTYSREFWMKTPDGSLVKILD